MGVPWYNHETSRPKISKSSSNLAYRTRTWPYRTTECVKLSTDAFGPVVRSQSNFLCFISHCHTVFLGYCGAKCGVSPKVANRFLRFFLRSQWFVCSNGGVIYARCDIFLDLFEFWTWYFLYLSARSIVKNDQSLSPIFSSSSKPPMFRFGFIHWKCVGIEMLRVSDFSVQ